MRTIGPVAFSRRLNLTLLLLSPPVDDPGMFLSLFMVIVMCVYGGGGVMKMSPMR